MDSRNPTIKRHCFTPLIVSYVASMFIYPLNGVFPNSIIVYLVMIIAVGGFGYALYNIYRRVEEKNRKRLLLSVILFYIILHILILFVTAILSGIVALIVGTLFIYQFMQRINVNRDENQIE